MDAPEGILWGALIGFALWTFIAWAAGVIQ